MSREKNQFANVGLQRQIQAGFDALYARDLRKAAAICDKTLQQAPQMPRAHFLAGLIALESGNRETAEHAFESTVRSNKMHAAAWARLAELYFTSGRAGMAQSALHNAVHAQRGNPATMDLIGTVFRLAGNLQASREWHQKAVDADRDRHVPYLIHLANAHIYSGDQELALEVLREAIAVDPGNGQLHWLLSRAGTADTHDHVAEMQALLGDDPRDNSFLNYAIGKELEDLGDWDGAFAAWTAGAAARRQTIAWSESTDIELFETLESTFTTEWMQRQQSDCFDAGPVFIVGQPRTGTTLLDRMLDAHPVVTSAGETRFLGFAVRHVTGSTEPRQFTPELMRQAAEADITAIGESYVALSSTLRLDAAHIVDKLPSNYLYLPVILAAMPNARIIHMRRDPMDTCLAVYKQLFADAYLYSYDLSQLARHLKRYLRLMDIWRERFSERFTAVDYEALVRDPEATLRPVLQFIGLSWNDDCLAYFKRDSAVTTASAQQVREAPHQRSVGHWRNFAKQLEPARNLLAP